MLEEKEFYSIFMFSLGTNSMGSGIKNNTETVSSSQSCLKPI
jgi:hypothetical protein